MRSGPTGFARAILIGIGAAVGVMCGASAQPVNDECAAATPVVSPGTYSSTTEGASGFAASPCGAPSDFFDVWYSFTAAATGAYRFDMQLSPGYVAATLSLHDACDGAVLVCDDGPDSGPTAGKPEINYQVEAGQTLLLRVAMCCGDRWPFTLRVGPGVLPVIPANDACSAAAAMTSGALVQGTNINATGGITSAPCVFAFNDTKDVWYSFTAPAAGFYEFKSRALTSTSFNPFYTTLALFDSCDGLQLACGDDQDPATREGSRIVRAIDAGESVLIRVAGYASGEGTFDLRVAATEPTAPPRNDVCESAVVVTGLPFSDFAPIAGATDDAAVSCGLVGAAREGVWYTYVPARDTNVFILNDTAIPVTATVYTGADCETSQEIACFRIISGAGYAGPDGADLIGGQRYWILMALEAGREVSADAAVAPRILDRGHDTCERAGVVGFPASIIGSNFIFHDEGVRASCYPAGDIDAWYEFTAPAAATYRFELLDRLERRSDGHDFWSPMEAPALSLYDACGGNELGCSVTGAGGTLVTMSRSLTSGQRVWIRVASNFALTGTYVLEVWSNAAAPSANDDCANALALAPGTGMKPFSIAGATTSASQDFTTSFAYASAGLAPVTLNNDVWYRWTAPATGLLNVRTNISGFRIAVYGGPACPPAAGSLLNATVNDREMSMSVAAGQALLIQIGAIAAGQTATANLFLNIVDYQGACCTGSECTVTTRTACDNLGSRAVFQGPNTACGPVSAAARTFADPVAVIIPQGATAATRTINVNDGFTVGGVAVQATINHPEISDVELILTHAGRSVTLTRQSGIPNEFTGVYIFSDAAIYPKGPAWFVGPTRDAAPGGYYRPEDRGVTTLLNDDVAGFGGVSSLGEWTLSVRDVLAPYRGVLNGWKLTLLPRDAAGPCVPEPSGACCAGSTCAVASATACMGPDTRFAGAGTACNAPGDWRTPCCIADFDQSGGPATLQDLFTFLAAWFAREPTANADGLGPTPDVNDIFAFLQAWFAGC